MSETLSDHHAESRKPLPALRLGDAKQVSAFMGKADMLNPLAFILLVTQSRHVDHAHGLALTLMPLPREGPRAKPDIE